MKATRYRRYRSRNRNGGTALISRKETNQEQHFFAPPSAASFFQPTTLHRKCEGCDKEEKKINKKDNGAGTGGAVSTAASQKITSLQGGTPLSATSRNFFEPRFGADLSEVRLHNDAKAHDMAATVYAKAFTYKNNIVFNKNQYQPENNQGKQLLAHELTHVLQAKQDMASRSIYRAPVDSGFDIRGIYPGAAGQPSTIFFEMGQAGVPPSETSKIPALAAPPTRNLTLVGTSSEEGTAGSNLSLINQRLRVVDSKLKSAGHKAPRTLTPQPTAGTGNIDYRRVRAVDVFETPAVVPPGGAMPSGTPPCTATPANPHPENEPCGLAFTLSHPFAMIWTSVANALLAAGNPAAVAHAAALFPGIPVATISGHLSNLKKQVDDLGSHHQCHNTCDGGCSRPAYNNGTGAGQMMTLCPGFLEDTNPMSQAETLIHESLHATPGLATQDTAYSTTRLISTLTGAQALNNTDSYVLLILRIMGIAPPSGAAVPDTIDPAITGADLNLTKSALSFLEQWLLNAEFDTSLLYSAINRNIGSATGWAASDNFEAEMAHSIASFVNITDPGPSAPFATAPKNGDQVKVAGMFDRYTQLRQKVYVTGLTVNKAAKGIPDSWNLATNTVTLGSAFFSLAPEDAVKHLLKLMIIALTTVPRGLQNPYVESANEIRKHRSTGP